MENMKYIQKNGNKVNVPIFRGKIIDNMSKIRNLNYDLISVRKIAEQTLRANEFGYMKILEKLENNFYDTCDSTIYHPDGRVKIVLNSKNIYNLNNESKIKYDGSLILPSNSFQNTEGFEFSKDDVNKYCEIDLTKKQILENPFWMALFNEDKHLLKEFRDYVFSEDKYSPKMRIYINKSRPRVQTERLWCLNGLDGNCVIDCDSYGVLNSNNAKLIGLPKNIEDLEKLNNSNYLPKKELIVRKLENRI